MKPTSDFPLAESKKVADEFEHFLNHSSTEKSEWNESMENLLKLWAERAAGYRWLHERCRDHHKRADVIFTLPQIILSSLAGSANLGLSSIVPAEQQTNANIIVGIVGIGVGILGAISQYLRHSALTEAHRAASINWGRLSRAIATELSLPPEDRTCPSIHFLRDQQATFDANLENSPPILTDALEEFRKRCCAGIHHDIFQNIAKPEITSGIVPVEIHGRAERSRAQALTDAATLMNKKSEFKAPNKWQIGAKKALKEKSDETIKMDDIHDIP